MWCFLAFKLLESSVQVPEKLHVARGKEERVGREAAHREQMFEELTKLRDGNWDGGL